MANRGVAAAFGLPFAEQIAFFRQKLQLPSQRFDDIVRQQHDQAFIVAGATGADLLNDLHEALAKAIEHGTTLEEFRRDFGNLVQKHGWTGWTGEDSAAGRAWRTRVIYNTNLRTSHAAGRWQQMRDPAVVAQCPYWEYVHVTIENPRIQHRALDGQVRRYDDPFWQTHYPPNGWGCQCRVRVRSAEWVQRNHKQIMQGASPYEAAQDAHWSYAPGASWRPDVNQYPPILQGLLAAWLAKVMT